MWPEGDVGLWISKTLAFAGNNAGGVGESSIEMDWRKGGNYGAG